MPAVTQVAILFCGQGMSTLIEYYAGGDTTAAPDNLVLLDFGGEQKHAANATSYVVSKLKMQTVPKFDMVIISHQDGDHLSLLGALTTAINKEGLVVGCGGWFAGGQAWSEANKKRVTDFANALTGVKVMTFNVPQQSDYEFATTRSALTCLCSFGSTYIRVLTSGLKLSSGAKDIVRNASSSVIVVENGEYAMILPGDATYHTMKVVNELYKSWGTAPLVPAVFTLEIPHHGALRTAVENYTAKTLFSKLNFDTIAAFAGYLKPQCVVASAGVRNTHCHPVKEVLDVFSGSLASHGPHKYVAWVFDIKKSNKHDGWYQYSTSESVYTTVKEVIGGTVVGDQLFYIQDASSTAAAAFGQRFAPRGFVSDADIARFDLEPEDQARNPANAVLRAPPPSGADVMSRQREDGPCRR